MTVDPNRADATLVELLRARAMRASERRLRADISGGLAIATLCTWLRPPWWITVVSAALCFAFYGIWAVAERQVQQSRFDTPLVVTRSWRTARALSAVVGVLALFALLASVMVRGLGLWVS